MNLLVLGGGAQGAATAFDLCRQVDVECVRLADLDPEPLPPFLRRFDGGKLQTVRLDARDAEAVAAAMGDVDVVACALPYYFNLDMARVAVRAGAHFCDLGGNTAIVERQRELDDEAREAGVSVIPDCGLAPGMVNILAQTAIEALDRTDEVRILVGGLPRTPRPPLGYQVVYSLEGVLDYYTTPGTVLEGGEPKAVEALSGLEIVEFPEPVGELEAFYTGGGISTLPRRYRGKIERMEYKTLRYPGHARIMKAIRELGLLDQEPIEVDGCEVAPRRLFIRRVQEALRSEDERDVVVLRVEVKGVQDGADRTIRWQLVDFYDEDEGLTAMTRATGFSLAVTALMQADGRIGTVGVRTPDECVPGDVYVTELAERGIHLERTDF